MKKKNSFASNGGFFSAFTLAEMMVVMLILSIVLAAMAPVMTTRSKPNNSTPWKYDTSINASARNNIWFGLGSSQHVMIGQDSFLGTDNAKLLINADGSTNSSIGFKNNGTAVGSLWFKNGGMLLGKFAEGGDLGSSAIAIGNEVNAAQEAVAIGKKASAGSLISIAIGNEANSDGGGIAIGYKPKTDKNSYAFGSSSKATGQSSVAIGTSAKTNAGYSIVMGNGANIQIDDTNSADDTGKKGSNDLSAIAIGTSANVLPSKETDVNKDNRNLRSPAAIAIGRRATAKYDGTIAIGKNASADGGAIRNRGEIGLSKTEHSSSIAIGREAKALNAGAISIGDSIQNSGPRAIAIGSKAKIIVDDGEEPRPGYDTDYYVTNGSIAIGAEASAESTSYKSDDTTYTTQYWRVEHAVAIGDKATAGHGGVAIGGSLVDSYRSWGGPTTATNGAVAVGESAKAAEGAVATGRLVEAKGKFSVAIGQFATTPRDVEVPPADKHSIKKIYRGAVAIGYDASAVGNSVAIGPGAEANEINQIVLGGENYTVYIPGNLIVGNKSFFGANITEPYESGVAGHWANGGVRTWIADYGGKRFDCWEGYNNQWGSAKAGYDGAVNYLNHVTSDRRLKYVGKENTSGLDKIRQLKVFNYTFKKDAKKEPHVGVIAQDLQKIFPNAVKKGADGFLTIRMEDMFYAVINAIKELDAKYQAQEKRINALEKENKEFKARLDKLEAKVK